MKFEKSQIGTLDPNLLSVKMHTCQHMWISTLIPSFSTSDLSYGLSAMRDPSCNSLPRVSTRMDFNGIIELNINQW